MALFSFRGNQQKILIFTQPDGREAAKSAHLELLQKLGANKKIALKTTALAADFTEDSLKNYQAVIFLNTVPAEVLDYRQQADFERFIQAGGGFMAINAVSDSVRNWQWYKNLNDARLKSAKASYQDKYDGGRVNFIQTGPEVTSKNTTKILATCLKYILGEGKLNYQKATTLRVPEENRFITEVIETYMYEPMEMVIFKDGRILYIERRGKVKLYNPVKKRSRVIANFDVSIIGNYEDGLLGVALDPNFETNNWIYFNYSPAGNIPKQHVSRFEMIGDSLLMSSEKVVLEIPTQRETCCHSAGHLEFGPNGDLYISTGDNTSSKESDGLSPIDERPGRMPFDAQKSSGNTNSLTGKILRIHPEPDGSYTIPKGNLFPPGTPGTRPEIYVMGTRNAFRFTVDKQNGYVYWGDVGPDSGVSSERGPQSYDEWNQARKAGNFGWPYFVGNSFAYADFDFATNKVGPKFKPEAPENLSPNNTGAKILPPAQKPMIWYPYSESKEFAYLGKGSRSAMAGPVYYAADYPAETRFPDYYNGKLFIYEWARSWVNVVSFDKEFNLTKIEPFLPEQPWFKPIDMKFGPDGALYILQYGTSYFAHNADSRLIKISYAKGNRQPIAKLSADKVLGAAPLTVNFSAAQSFDYDKKDKLSFSWKFNEAVAAGANTSEATYTFTKPGIYRPTVIVTDSEGKSTATDVEIKVGNEPPQVVMDLGGANRSFYYDNQKINYKVIVTDKEDGTLQKGIDPSVVFMSFDYLNQSRDLALLASNPQMTGGLQFLRGKTLIAGSDCQSCHNLDKTNIGPSYSEIAKRYYRVPDAPDILTMKVLKGGNGQWGKNMMAAHPQHTKEEAMEMVKYILSLSSKQNIALPLAGSITTNQHVADGGKGIYVIRASYADKGHPPIGSLSENLLFKLRNPKVQAKDFDILKGVDIKQMDGSRSSFISAKQDGAYIGLTNIDLTAIDKLTFSCGTGQAGSRIEIRLDAPDGKLVGTAEVPLLDKNTPFKNFSTTILNANGQHHLYLVFRNGKNRNDLLNLEWVYFDNGNGRQASK
ncbi:hypothetical protein AAE02nite_13840 [Adhaeribacter aerolatus]|uniref:Carbohydrate-binding protein n=1 Tax=Adhaeribacter aerolatus TaxID=670289 RepID=A0A512AVM0_9BACT|nr:PQQ-dependent sugar dehydrogenase [Adhaeribacter aerolatus]GEO03720.1 hypothetical protein AAE02nite_13840 [Adhaeribacter aerolatus]